MDGLIAQGKAQPMIVAMQNISPMAACPSLSGQFGLLR